jgi:hypothetical protein
LELHRLRGCASGKVQALHAKNGRNQEPLFMHGVGSKGLANAEIKGN